VGLLAKNKTPFAFRHSLHFLQYLPPGTMSESNRSAAATDCP